MKTFTTWTGQHKDRGAVAAIGNFDGVHLGHQTVIEITRAEAARRKAPLGILTFEPHPREFFAPDAPAFRLMNAEAKEHRLAKLGVDHLYQLPFDTHLASQTPEEFVRDVLVEGLGVSHVVVGADFCFGKARAGSAEDLQQFGKKYGFGVTLVPLLAGGSVTVSSTAIRNALAEGRPRDVAAMLGHWHRLEGPVIKGDQRGRDLGFPTANLSLDGLHKPRFGVYAVLVDVLSGPHAGTYHGAASIGVKPMFGADTPNCESFLFDFKGDLYDQHLSVGLIEYLRDERKFPSIEALIDQMGRDCDQARAILAAL